MESMRIRRHIPILPRIEDLERSHQWTGLTCDIGNLERLNTVDRSRARKSTLKQSDNTSRVSRAKQRCSMPEITKPNLVYVRMTNSENVRSTRDKIDDRDERTRSRDRYKPGDAVIDDRCSWKPRTEFERNYFGVMENVAIRNCPKNEIKKQIDENHSTTKRDIFAVNCHNDETTKSPLAGYYRNADDISEDFVLNDETTLNRYVDKHRQHTLEFNCHSDENISNSKTNERRKTCTSGSSFYYGQPDGIPEIRRDNRPTRENNSMLDGTFARAENNSPFSPAKEDSRDLFVKYKNDKIELPARRYVNEDDSTEYHGSRERLHEIFAHNRLLRRQFFATIPAGINDSNNINNKNNNDENVTCNNEEKDRLRNRLEIQKNSGISGFGSTETLTSQSNQSGASSTNGRKSRIEFGNTPEPSEDPRIFDKVPSTKTTIDLTRNKIDDSRDDVDRQVAPFTCNFLPLPSKSSMEYRANSCDDINENDLYDDVLDSQRISRDRLKESPIDVNNDLSLRNSTSILDNRERTNSLDSDKKFFATYVNVNDCSELDVTSSTMIDRPRVGKTKNVPPPLDLTMIDQQWDDRWEREREFLKNYTIEVTPLRDYEGSSRGILTVLGDDDCRSKKTLINSPNGNDCTLLRGSKSLLELSANLSRSTSASLTKIANVDSSKLREKCVGNRFSSIIDDLRSPQLVSNFSNSLNDLVDRVDDDEPNQRTSRNIQDNDEEDNSEESREASSTDSVRRKSEIDSTTPGNGTTLPLVYGPIPYKSPRRYVEGEVTIHYRSPVRQEAKEILSEEELARRSAENMRRVYQEERRRKYLQELHDIDSRRHTDNFVPSQKSPIPLNRYDDFVDDLSYRSRSQEQTPEPRLVARALYNFVGQSSRELTFRRGDLIFVRRQVDKNWYEGEHNAMIGLFPFNYVEILPYDGVRTTPKKPYEGQARAKFNFVAQTNLELSLAKGELVVVTRRVDENWFEGRIGNRKGIFPISYVEVIAEPGHRSETPVQSSKPVASPAAHSLLSNGTAGGKMSMGAHHYTPSIPVNTGTTQPHYNSLPRMGGNKLHVAPVNETLHIDTHSETIPYRALYNYRPQNEDELELKEGDTVYVMEKCDDGWYVGSSQRTGYFGTFPGNYVERL